MPTYEYACTSCGDRLEAVQSFAEEALTTCPTCGGPLRKVFGNVGIVLKGSGFYKTDSRNGSSGGRKDTPKESTSAGETASKDSSSSAKVPASSSTGTEKAAAAAP